MARHLPELYLPKTGSDGLRERVARARSAYEARAQHERHLSTLAAAYRIGNLRPPGTQ